MLYMLFNIFVATVCYVEYNECRLRCIKSLVILNLHLNNRDSYIAVLMSGLMCIL